MFMLNDQCSVGQSHMGVHPVTEPEFLKPCIIKNKKAVIRGFRATFIVI